MTRRRFVQKIIQSFGWTLAASILPFNSACATAKSDQTSREKDVMAKFQDVTLEEIAGKRLHHGHDRFLNPFSDASPGGFFKVMKWKLFSKNHFTHLYDKDQVRPVTIDWGPVKAHSGVSVTFINHASVMIKDIDHYLLIDPVYFGINRWIENFSPLNQNRAEFPMPDQVLITHGHYDHLDRRTLKHLGPSPHIISPLGHESVIRDINSRHTTLDWYQTVSSRGRRITLLPAHHWTMRNPLVGPNRALWGAFLIETAGGPTIFISGDTAYTDRFKEIGAAYTIDLAILSVGAYEPRWMMKHSHMNPNETLRSFRDLGARRLLPVHWGTFRLGDEPVYLPPVQLREAMQNANLIHKLIELTHGETLHLVP